MCPVSHCSYGSACYFCHLLKLAFVIGPYLLLAFFLLSERETKIIHSGLLKTWKHWLKLLTKYFTTWYEEEFQNIFGCFSALLHFIWKKLSWSFVQSLREKKFLTWIELSVIWNNFSSGELKWPSTV